MEENDGSPNMISLDNCINELEFIIYLFMFIIIIINEH